LLFVLLLTGCSQNLYMQGRKLAEQGQYDRAIDVYYEELKVNPQNAAAWRELGIAFYDRGDFIKAEEALKQANHIKPEARTSLYIGLIHEKSGDYDKAIQAYAGALNLNPPGKLEPLIQTHLDELILQKIRNEALQAIDEEDRIEVGEIPDNSIAVVDFDNSQLPVETAPIARGLAEFTSVDLSKIRDLNVVDRLKIDVILDELKLSSSDAADPEIGPRLGKLMGSRRLVSGSLLSTDEGRIRLDGAIISTLDSSASTIQPLSGELSHFFKIQKDFVFNLIGELGLELSVEERDAIEEVPTESFLAFMAYCRGLQYQERGMYGAARTEYGKAVDADPAFMQAADRLRQVSDIESGLSEYDGSMEGFEKTAAVESQQELYQRGLDRIQAAVLMNAGFIGDRDLFDRYGNPPYQPPRISEGTTVIIRGVVE